MRMILKSIITVVVLTLLLPVLMVSAAVNVSTSTEGNQKTDLRGLWVATVINMDYPKKPTNNYEVLKNEAVTILDNAENMGLNAIFLQVRPASDSLYKSKIFPWSKYLTGSQGLMPDADFDPLAFWIDEAHKRGMQLHAWLNPYRVTKRVTGEPIHDFASLHPSNPARTNPDWVVKHSDGNLYFDPGIPEVRNLIKDSIVEIIGNYDVDGIHFDDYFYPGKDFSDKGTFEKYGSAYNSIDNWRRENVNTLIRDVSNAVKAASKSALKDVRFGVSPFGIWANKSSNSLGSDTRGSESYHSHYADSRKWVKEGIIDYITPQLYWNIGYSVADYSKLLSWWGNVVDGTGVDLYIGQAAYRSGSSDPSSAWYGVSEIERQLKLNEKTPQVKGSIFFNYTSLVNNPALGAVIKDIFQLRDGMKVSIPVNVSRPSSNIRTKFEKFYLNGSSDPAKPLFLNGKEVENRSPKGYFGILVSLNPGANIFTLSQDASYQTRVIYRDSAAVPQKMSSIGIPASSAFPQSQEYRQAGEKITLSCQAPIGAKVTVKLGGKVYEMKPSTTKSYGTGLYPATFTYVYTVPGFTGTPRNVNLGAPVYTLKYKGAVKTRTAPGKVGVIMKNSPFYGKVEKAVINTYHTPSSSDGAAFELYKGMTDYVTGMTGSFVRLSQGQWVKKADIRAYTSKSQLHAVVKGIEYKTGTKWDTVQFDISSSSAAIASFDGTAIKLDVSAAQGTALPGLPENSMIAAMDVSKNDKNTRFVLTLKDGQVIEGYHIEKTSKGILLYMKRPVRAKGGAAPLLGITIMLDPGHGGKESGAPGPLGLKYGEKTINLKTAEKLRTELLSLGAKVLMTRTTDKTVSLDERLTASRNARPDMFISLHANSMEDDVDISRIEGFSVFYREMLAKPLSDVVYNHAIETLNRNTHGVHKKNFYVTRGTWTPSILIESGFVPNPAEFEWLTDEKEQSILAKTLAESIVEYFN